MRRLVLLLVGFYLGSCSGSLRPPVVPAAEQATVAADLGAFVDFALRPAGVAPPTVSWGAREATDGPVRAHVTPLRPEDAAWNRWPDGTARLFNNRVALLFLVRVEADGPLTWRARETTIELNGPELRLRAVAGADELLGELTFWALMQERWLLDGDLAERTRAAGPFRDAYLRPVGADGVLEGLVAFELVDPDAPERVLAEEHVVAVRLTLVVESASGVHRLVWVFE